MSPVWLHAIESWMQAFHDAGWTGWFSFLAFYAVACLFFVPGSIMAFGAGALYGFWGGLLLALLGNGLSAILSLLITRYLLHDWSSRFFSRNPMMHALATAVQKDGWRIVCLCHLTPIMPFSVVNYAFGLTRIPAVEYLPATLLGGLPANGVYVYLGTIIGNLATLRNGLPHHPLVWCLQVIGLVATIILTVYLTRRATQVLKQRLPLQESATPSGPS